MRGTEPQSVKTPPRRPRDCSRLQQPPELCQKSPLHAQQPYPECSSYQHTALQDGRYTSKTHAHPAGRQGARRVRLLSGTRQLGEGLTHGIEPGTEPSEL
ncbi:hypothetical protein HPB48_022193 [Haemaphysalis longicornis]|uniref:Uncharacterized protein n=1 Tax=Haemaphysalis longicornis TaxID=44386 RepID=A0A9J6GHN7_HAELO|nr:hypothetical protein HPB48_022193 [Haemaphysalis longicornis]